MFAGRMFCARFFAPRYFARPSGAATAAAHPGNKLAALGFYGCPF